MLMSPDSHFTCARNWAIWLTRQPSVTGTEGERDLPLKLAAQVGETKAFESCRTWLIPAENDPLGRSCFALLVRGKGPDTVLLTGHFDTVTTEDYGELGPLATEPEALAAAMLARLSAPSSMAETLAAADLASGEFLPGRGLLDMKSGLAAGLAAAEAFARLPDRVGNLLFVAVPDEEVNSVGARALAAALPVIEREHDIQVRGAINLDCIGDLGDGSIGRAVAMGSVGKLLLTALVIGQPSHASHPFQGINAGALAGAIAARLEWAPELADSHGAQPGIPPVLLSVKDSKLRYDVTTPEMTFVTWNALTQRRGAGEVMTAFRGLVEDAVRGFTADLARRREAVSTVPGDVLPVPVLLASDLLAEALLLDGATSTLSALGATLARDMLSLPDQNEVMTREAWRLTRRSGPAVILGFGSLPYPSVLLGDTPAGTAFLSAIEAARARAMLSGGESIARTWFFPGISDMSFLGEASTADIGLIAANTPAWATGVRWGGSVGGIPTVNIGPWGRDYHTPLERVHQRYTFSTLPAFLLDTVQTYLTEHAP